jgi:hypothetical protein
MAKPLSGVPYGSKLGSRLGSGYGPGGTTSLHGTGSFLWKETRNEAKGVVVIDTDKALAALYWYWWLVGNGAEVEVKNLIVDEAIQAAREFEALVKDEGGWAEGWNRRLGETRPL